MFGGAGVGWQAGPTQLVLVIGLRAKRLGRRPFVGLGNFRVGKRPTLRIEESVYLPRVKRIGPLFVVALIGAFLLAPFAWSVGTNEVRSTADRSPGAPVAHALSTVTG